MKRRNGHVMRRFLLVQGAEGEQGMRKGIVRLFILGQRAKHRPASHIVPMKQQNAVPRIKYVHLIEKHGAVAVPFAKVIMAQIVFVIALHHGQVDCFPCRQPSDNIRVFLVEPRKVLLHVRKLRRREHCILPGVLRRGRLFLRGCRANPGAKPKRRCAGAVELLHLVVHATRAPHIHQIDAHDHAGNRQRCNHDDGQQDIEDFTGRFIPVAHNPSLVFAEQPQGCSADFVTCA